MDISASEWSSGCESGWTNYLDDSSPSPNDYQRSVFYHQTYNRGKHNEEEDLSMVSDASSGPPHFRYGAEEEEDVECNGRTRSTYPPSSSSSEKLQKKKKKKEKEPASVKKQHSFLDDTASSPDLGYPNGCTDPSNNQHSTTNHFFGYSHEDAFKANSAFSNQVGYWPPPLPRQQDSNEHSRSRGRRRG